MPKRDMQKIILKILTESKKNNIPYLTRKQIVDKIEKIKPKMKNVDRKVSQALYLLKIKQHRKWNAPKVIQYEKEITVEGEKKVERGWTIKDESYS